MGRTLALSVSSVLALLVGLASTVVLLFQPWRTCEDDDSPAGCPVTVLDGNLMLGAVGLSVLGIVLLALAWRPPAPSR